MNARWVVLTVVLTACGASTQSEPSRESSGDASMDDSGTVDAGGDVACTLDVQCAELGSDYACDQGWCREHEAVATDGGIAFGEPDALCDGSTSIRLGYSVESGFADWNTTTLVVPYGDRFVYIDGQCRYYASANPFDAVVTGTLSPEQAEAIAEGVYWDELATVAREPINDPCFEHGTSTLWGRGALIRCICCQSSPRSRGAEALNFLQGMFSSLIAGGKPVVTPMLARAALEGPPDGERANTWPLDRTVASIDDFVRFGDDRRLSMFPEPAEAAALRSLRNMVEPAPHSRLYVTDGAGEYRVWLRDAFPEGVEERIRTFRGYR